MSWEADLGELFAYLSVFSDAAVGTFGCILLPWVLYRAHIVTGAPLSWRLYGMLLCFVSLGATRFAVMSWSFTGDYRPAVIAKAISAMTITAYAIAMWADVPGGAGWKRDLRRLLNGSR